MRKPFILFLLLSSYTMAFAQAKLPFTSSKPFNKGNMELKLGYEHQPAYKNHGEAPKICLSAGYGFTDWCVAGAHVEFGRDFGDYVAIGDGEYWCQYHSNYVLYGIQAELHPIPLLLPGFYFADFYTIIRGGMYHFICDKVSEQGSSENQEWLLSGLKNTALPYIAGGWGVAVNPSRYFGLFYERSYMSLEQCNPELANGSGYHLYHRLGINIRFGGPKRWQR